MIEQPKAFEDTFNKWYKTFLVEEKEMNNKIKTAQNKRQEIIDKAKKEALEIIRNYEVEQKDKLEADKEKLNVQKNNFDQLDADFQNEVEIMKEQHKNNKEKVINYLINNILNVELELPASILIKKNEDENENRKKKNKE
jgi:hypothetical protein